MLNLTDLIINVFESFLYAMITADFIDVISRKKIRYILIFTLVLTIEITLFNQITLYDGIYSFIYIITYTYMMTLFGEERDSGAVIHNIIYAINFDSLISLGNESVFLFAVLFFNISPLQMAQNHIVITFVFSRLILLLISLIIHKLTKVYKNVSSIHDKYFVIVFAIMHVLIILNECKFRPNGLLISDHRSAGFALNGPVIRFKRTACFRAKRACS